MAASLVALPLRVSDAASANQFLPAMTSGGASQAPGPEPTQLPEEEARLCSTARVRAESEASTATGDTASEISGLETPPASPRNPSPILGNVLSLSFSPEGCRRVQDALVQAASQSEQELLANELRGHAVRATRCPHANHVLQKCISILPAPSLQFMIEELLEHEGLVKKVATHSYGGRIVQQLLSKCGASQEGQGLAEAVLQDAVALSCHSFGNYAVQHLMEGGTEEQKYSLGRTLERNMGIIGRSVSGSWVIAAALGFAAAEDWVWIARAVVQDPGLLLHLAHGRHGHEAVLRALSVLRGPELVQARKGLMGGMDELKASRYGRKIAAYLEAVAGQ